MDINNSHDKFFKETFTDKSCAIDFFEEILSDNLLINID